MKIGYARKSTGSQDHALQMDALNMAGCERVFTETASGTKSDRAELRALLDFARDGEDIVVVYALSRLARSIRHLLDIGDELNRRRIGLCSLTEAVDTTTPQGRFVFAIMGAMSQMEVDLLRERTRAGLSAARARGRVGGRPKSLDDRKLQVAKALISDGQLTMAEIAEQVGVRSSTLYRHLPGGRSGMSDERPAVELAAG